MIETSKVSFLVFYWSKTQRKTLRKTSFFSRRKYSSQRARSRGVFFRFFSTFVYLNDGKRYLKIRRGTRKRAACCSRCAQKNANTTLLLLFVLLLNYSYCGAGKKKSCNRLRWTSTSPTRTETFSPARAISCGSFLASSYLSLFSFLQNVDLWIKPLVSTPTSTKMPN